MIKTEPIIANKNQPRYLIKVTILTGRHKGHSYLLRKGGYVTDEGDSQFEEDTYKTLGTALRVCKQMESRNELNYNVERADNEYRIKQGKSPKEFFIYEKESYEPYLVENIVILNI